MLRYTKNELLELAIEYHSRTGKQPTTKTWNIKNVGCSKDRVYEQFGSWKLFTEALSQRLANVKIPKYSTYTDAELLNFLILYKERYNKNPTQRAFKKLKNYPDSFTYNRHFGSWNNALILAGLELNNKYNYYTKEILIEAILDYVAETGELPTIRGFKLASTCQLYFGSLNKAIEAAGFEPNIQNGFGIDTVGLDGHLYRSQSEAYFADMFLYGKYSYVVEPKYPKPYNKWYDWYIVDLDLYIELDGGLRPLVIEEKIRINKALGRNLVVYTTDEIYRIEEI